MYSDKTRSVLICVAEKKYALGSWSLKYGNHIFNNRYLNGDLLTIRLVNVHLHDYVVLTIIDDVAPGWY